jgi:hypothetical protein
MTILELGSEKSNLGNKFYFYQKKYLEKIDFPLYLQKFTDLFVQVNTLRQANFN